jgi:polyisoprenoid-binding protein YceI
MIRRLSITSAGILFALASSASASTWEIDSSHSGAQFAVRHLMVSNVRGEFSKVTGTIETDDTDSSVVKVTATIDASTINTREAKRDEHLKSPDFFDVAKYPTITFKSRKAEKAGTGKYKVVGDLTMHGVTKEVTLDVSGVAEFKGPRGSVVGASVTTKLNRKDFGLEWNRPLETGGVLVGEEVEITIDVEAKKVEAPAAK